MVLTLVVGGAAAETEPGEGTAATQLAEKQDPVAQARALAQKAQAAKLGAEDARTAAEEAKKEAESARAAVEVLADKAVKDVAAEMAQSDAQLVSWLALGIACISLLVSWWAHNAAVTGMRANLFLEMRGRFSGLRKDLPSEALRNLKTAKDARYPLGEREREALRELERNGKVEKVRAYIMNAFDEWFITMRLDQTWFWRNRFKKLWDSYYEAAMTEPSKEDVIRAVAKATILSTNPKLDYDFMDNVIEKRPEQQNGDRRGRGREGPGVEGAEGPAGSTPPGPQGGA